MPVQNVTLRKNLTEGVHRGVIIAIDVREKPFAYNDYIIESENTQLKYGVPSEIAVDEKLNPKTKHARLLKNLGLLKNNSIDTDKAIGLKVTFMTINHEKEKGVFTEIVDDSVKLLPKKPE